MTDRQRKVCPICEMNNIKLWSNRTWYLPFSPDKFRLFECNQCGSIFSSPRPTQNQLNRFYAEFYNYSSFTQHILFKEIQGWHRWQRVKSLMRNYHLRRGRLLDIGCGHGLFLKWVKKDNWEAIGIDYPSEATAYARRRFGLNIIDGDFLNLSEGERRRLGLFDLITLWHCLEHTTDPVYFLSQVKDFLKPTGKILIAVPNGACSGMRLKRENWVWCQQAFVHTVHFTPKSLLILTQKVGLNCLSIWSRDTWDANYPFDVYFKEIINKIALRIKRRSKRLAFYFEEGFRLLCYAIGGFKHWFLNQESLPEEGSGLLLLARDEAY